MQQRERKKNESWERRLNRQVKGMVYWQRKKRNMWLNMKEKKSYKGN